MNAPLSLPRDLDLLPADTERREQMRLTRLTLFNWGTFSGLHEIPIAPQGFLFVGRSGSGKSTLLDAFTTLLIPPRWSSFNMAAREGERARADRNLVTYVRGAWADQSSAETGESVNEIEAMVEGTDLEIAFNAKYLIDVLSQIEQAQVVLETSQPTRPGTIRPLGIGEEEFLHVVMPMHPPR